MIVVNYGNSTQVATAALHKVVFVGLPGTNGKDFDPDILDEYLTRNEAEERFGYLTRLFEEQEGKIALMVTRDQLNLLTGRLDRFETQLTINAEEIRLRAYQSSLEVLTGRVTVNEASLSVMAGRIALAVTRSEYDEQKNLINTLKGSIEVQAGLVALKASQTSVDALAGRTTVNEGSINILNNSISAKVSTSVYDANNVLIGQKFASVELSVGSIISTVQGLPTKEYVQGAIAAGGNGELLATYNTRINQLENLISLTATKTTTDNLGNRLGIAEGNISVLNGQISLMVTQTSYNAQGEKINSLEAQLVIQSGLIQSKVSQTDLNGNNLVSIINQTAGAVKIKAELIELEGLVVARTLVTAPSGRRITINLNNDNAIKIWYQNGVAGLEAVVTPNNEVKLVFKNQQGEIIWEAGKSGFVYLREINESWSPRFHRLVGVLIETMEEFYDLNGNLMFSGEQLRSMAGSTTNTNGLAVRGERVQISDGQIYEYRDYQLNTAQFVTDYEYNAGQNLNSSINDQYNGIHLDAEKASPFIATGWYLTNGSAYGWSPLGGYSFQYEVVAIFQGKVIGSVTGQVDNINLPNN